MCKHQCQQYWLLFLPLLYKLRSSTSCNGFLRIQLLHSWSHLHCIFSGNLDSQLQCYGNIQRPLRTDNFSMDSYCNRNCKFLPLQKNNYFITHYFIKLKRWDKSLPIRPTFRINTAVGSFWLCYGSLFAELKPYSIAVVILYGYAFFVYYASCLSLVKGVKILIGWTAPFGL